MPRNLSRRSLDGLQTLFESGTLTGLNEAELLKRYVIGGDERAFEVLVERLGPMVMGVCRRRLNDPRDVEDAFQATFLILVRKAAALRDASRLAPWLYGVAYRVATRARQNAAARGVKERPCADVGQVEAPCEPSSDDLRRVLDEELSRLPDKYRRPVVFVHLEGLSHDEAAAQLGWPVGTVRSRLSRARDRLRSRLVRRGFAPGLVAFEPGVGSLWVRPEVTRQLVGSVVQAAARSSMGRALTSAAVSGTVVQLTRGVLTAMWVTKLTVASLIVTGAVVLGAGSMLAAQQAGAGKPAVEGRGGPPAENRLTLPSPAGPGPTLHRVPALEANSSGSIYPAELAVRLKMAMEKAELQGGMYRGARLGRVEYQETLGQVELVRAQIRDQADRLQEEKESLEAEVAIQEAAVRRAGVNRKIYDRLNQRIKGSVSQEELQKADSDTEMELAKLSLIKVRLRYATLRHAELRRLVESFAASLPKALPGQPVQGAQPPTSPARDR